MTKLDWKPTVQAFLSSSLLRLEKYVRASETYKIVSQTPNLRVIPGVHGLSQNLDCQRIMGPAIHPMNGPMNTHLFRLIILHSIYVMAINSNCVNKSKLGQLC